MSQLAPFLRDSFVSSQWHVNGSPVGGDDLCEREAGVFNIHRHTFDLRWYVVLGPIGGQNHRGQVRSGGMTTQVKAAAEGQRNTMKDRRPISHLSTWHVTRPDVWILLDDRHHAPAHLWHHQIHVPYGHTQTRDQFPRIPFGSDQHVSAVPLGAML